MPFIHLTTNKILTLHQDIALKENLNQLFPDEDVMLHIEDNQIMYYQDGGNHCMKVDVYLTKMNYDISALKKQVCQSIEIVTGIEEGYQLFSFIDCLYVEREL